ncbi:hypothetical protein ACLB2K_056519 [Fragaria x ananassa]
MTKCFGKDIDCECLIPVAEALALCDSLVYAKANGHTRLEVEGDSKIVIDAVNEVFDPPWRLIKIVEDIKSVAAQFVFISFRQVFREANFVADAITHLRHSLPNGNTWVNRVSIEATHVLVFDIVNSII